MKKLVALSTAAAVLTTAIVSAAVASQNTRATLQQCASLLPAGKVYTFEVSGNVDTTGKAPKLSGEMSVSDGTQVDRSHENAAFGQCVAKLLK
jgi:hypothetical protein